MIIVRFFDEFPVYEVQVMGLKMIIRDSSTPQCKHKQIGNGYDMG